MNSERICKKRNLLFKCILFIFSFKTSAKLVVLILKRMCTLKYRFVRVVIDKPYQFEVNVPVCQSLFCCAICPRKHYLKTSTKLDEGIKNKDCIEIQKFVENFDNNGIYLIYFFL